MPPAPVRVMPLVLRDMDYTVLSLDRGQQSAAKELRSEFIAQVDGDPSSPAYVERLREAQQESDQLLRAMIGVNAFMQYQNEAQ